MRPRFNLYRGDGDVYDSWTDHGLLGWQPAGVLYFNMNERWGPGRYLTTRKNFNEGPEKNIHDKTTRIDLGDSHRHKIQLSPHHDITHVHSLFELGTS